MEKKQSDEVVIDQDAPSVNNGVHGAGTAIAKVTGSEIVSTEIEFDEMPDVSQLTEMKRGKSYTAKYRTQEDWYEHKDKPIRAWYKGMKEIPNDKGEAIKAAVFVDGTGIFLSAQKMLIDGVRHMLTNTPVEILYKGKKPNKNSEGSTNIFEVYELTEE
jgi:hypothetical protein